MKTYSLNGTTVNYETIQYFYKRETNDKNGNPRYRVFIIDPIGLVYEKIFKCYEFQIEERIISLIENQ